MLVHNALTELSEDLRLAAKSDGHTAQMQLAKASRRPRSPSNRNHLFSPARACMQASAEFQQLSEYLSIRIDPPPSPPADASDAPARCGDGVAVAPSCESSESLQCKVRNHRVTTAPRNHHAA